MDRTAPKHAPRSADASGARLDPSLPRGGLPRRGLPRRARVLAAWAFGGVVAAGAVLAPSALPVPTSVAFAAPGDLTVSFTADDKTYDGNPAATLSGVTLSGVDPMFPDVQVLYVANFADADAGVGKTVDIEFQLTGTDAPFYTLLNPTESASAEIRRRALTVTATATDKPFDGTTTASVTLGDDRLPGDVLTVTAGPATFADPFVGTHKTVTVPAIAVLPGGDAPNYALANTTATTHADILPVFRTDAAQLAFDSVAGALSTLYSGPTSWLATADLNGDDRPDVVHATTKGVQVFRNDGALGGPLVLTLVQEIEALWSKGGGIADTDGDGDLDLVLGAVSTLRIARNDLAQGGTGTFTTTDVLTHGFNVPTVALPFRARTVTGAPGDELRILLGASADGGVAMDLVGGTSDGKPHVYVLRHDGTSWVVLSALDSFNLDGAVVRDVDGDGVHDVLAANRSGVVSQQPFYLYRGTGTGYAPVPLPFLGTYGFPFAFGPAEPVLGPQWNQPVANDAFAVGSWHRVSVFPHTGGFTFGAPTHASLDPGNALGFPIAEAFSSAFADMDGDGDAELLSVGRSVPLVVLDLAGDPNLPGNRFQTAVVPGTFMDVAAADFDDDANDAPDALVGGSEGLWYYHNPNGAAPGTGVPAPPPAPPTPGEELRDARDILYAALDPRAADRLGADVPTYLNTASGQSYYDRVQFLTHRALAELSGIDPAYTDVVPNGIFGFTPADQVETLRGYYDRVATAIGSIGDALMLTTDPDDQATLLAVAGHLFDAQIGIVAQGQSLGGIGAPFKRASARTIRRLRVRSVREQQEMLDAIAAARITTDARERAERIDVAVRAGRLSLRAVDAFVRAATGGRGRR